MGDRRPVGPVVLTVAGSDSCGGAGIQADLATIHAHGGYGASVVTAVTAQHTHGVMAVHPVPEDVIAAQLEAVLSDLPEAAIKVGMLGGVGAVRALVRALKTVGDLPVVVDPVMRATVGPRLLEPEALSWLRDELLPRATLITPNHAEARRLADERDVQAWASDGAPAVLLTGGDEAGQQVVDVLYQSGLPPRIWRADRVEGGPFHGTGCTLSSAITARLARGEDLEEAVAEGIRWVQQRLTGARRLGKGSALLPHGTSDI